jgi:hypothetical protein
MVQGDAPGADEISLDPVGGIQYASDGLRRLSAAVWRTGKFYATGVRGSTDLSIAERLA